MDAPPPHAYPRRMRNHPGYTLIELTLVLLLATLLLTAAAPSMIRGRRVVAVRAARGELISAIAAARSAAILTGGATAVIDGPAAAVWIESADGVRIGDARSLGATHGVHLELDRGTRASLRFDALGIGRLANAAVRIRRGDVTARITVSAYGRVRS
ncbi:MAG: GspH/FimT family pseudopilin [Gemmatimonadota bacterium]